MTVDEAIKDLLYNVPSDEAIDMAIKALEDQKERATGVLCTIYETPESCPHCYEHLSLEWSYCPECGKPTSWSKQ